MSNRRTNALISAFVLGIGLNAAKLPVVNAEETNRPMIVYDQNNDSREYSPDVVKLYDAYLKGLSIENQMNPELNERLQFDIEIAHQANLAQNMLFPFDDAISEQELESKTIQTLSFLERTAFYGIYYNIPEALPSNYIKNELHAAYVRQIENLANRINLDPNNQDNWIAVINEIRGMDRYSYLPNVEFANSCVLLGALALIPANFIYAIPNTNREVPVTAFEMLAHDKDDEEQRIAFYATNKSGTKYTQHSMFGNYAVQIFSRGQRKLRIGQIFSRGQMIEMGANPYGVTSDAKEVHLKSVDSLATTIEANSLTAQKTLNKR